ncbi:MAG: ABC transporter ATP-binding protein [Hydrogenibacillus schlegelii]|uniref:ABC transporter ATP-binding protein n=1 Tax=Hydrogenibacillus schlegelii TaxID=1484 RepID=A0A947CU41_HYDSH|nr:ABC transporter ATP-binding protein [Hydrogenibacillus schlegelii]
MIVLEGVVKIFKSDDIEVTALQGVDLTVPRGALMAIIGKSGSGKSTLLNILGGLDVPSAGRVRVAGRDLHRLTPKQLGDYRLRTVGFVWQNGARNLLPYLTVLENVLIPMRLLGRPDREYAAFLLERVGLGDRLMALPGSLSGGEQQRVAIAVALANRPPVLLADEPTGALDSRTARTVLELFRDLNRTLGTTIVIVTHDRTVAAAVDRVVMMHDGLIAGEFLRADGQAVSGEAAPDGAKSGGADDYDAAGTSEAVTWKADPSDKEAGRAGLADASAQTAPGGGGRRVDGREGEKAGSRTEPGTATDRTGIAETVGLGPLEKPGERSARSTESADPSVSNRPAGHRISAGSAGLTGSHRSYAIIDTAGRLRLPEEDLEALGFGRLAVVERTDGGLFIRPAGVGSFEAAAVPKTNEKPTQSPVEEVDR